MSYLTESEIEELDRQIDERINTFPLLQRPRDLAVLTLFLAFEEYVAAREKIPILAHRRRVIQKGYHALDHAMHWVLQRSPSSGSEAALEITSELSTEGEELLKEGIEYGKIWVQMALLMRGRTLASAVGVHSFEFTPKIPDPEHRDTGRMLIEQTLDPAFQAVATGLTTEVLRYTRNKLEIKRSGGKLEYDLKQDAFGYLRQQIETRLPLEWSMDPTWDLGGYTFAELRVFWSVLRTMQMVHDIAYTASIRHDDKPARRTRNTKLRLLIKSRQEWISAISGHSELGYDTTAAILNDLVLLPSLYTGGGSRPHVLLQPFFRFSDGLIVLSGKAAHISRIERNVWTLLGHLRKPMHDELKNKKETFWIAEMSKELGSRVFQCIPNISFKNSEVQGNIDWLVISKEERFGLVCELKWLTSTDDPKGVTSQDAEILKGAGQVQIAVDWLKNNLESLSQRFNISPDELTAIEFKPLVITKENLPSGFIDVPPVPVINEKLFRWMLIYPHSRGLRETWSVAACGGYLPKPGVHFEPGIGRIEWGRLRFTLKNLVFSATTPWDPKTDIDFSP